MKTIVRTGAALLMLLMLVMSAGALAEQEAGTLALPAGLRVIGEEAFLNAAGVQHVTLPEGAQEIGERAFAGSSVKTMDIPPSVRQIADNAFLGVDGLTVRGEAGSYAQTYCEAHGIAFAVDPVYSYPRSAHPYAPDMDQTWHYAGSPDARSLLVTFSENTVVEYGDYITIYDQYGNQAYRYTEDRLAGRTLVVSGNAFSVRLQSDASGEAYGFAVTAVEEDLVNQPVTVSSVVLETAPADVFEEAKWVVNAEGTYQPFTYNYVLRRDGYVDRREEGSSNVFAAELYHYATYTLEVSVVDSDYYSVYAYAAPLALAQEPFAVRSIVPGAESSSAGNMITWTVEIQGDKQYLPHQYTYTVLKDGEDVYSGTASAQERVTTFSYVPMEMGTYTLTVAASEEENTAELTGGTVAVSDFAVCPEEDFICEMTDEQSVRITGYTGSANALVIPESIGGLPVSRIGLEAFCGNENIYALVIPDTVTIIEHSAFEGCSNLRRADLKWGLTEIGRYAFSGCTSLKSIRVPGSVTYLGQFAFSSCTSLTDFGYPKGLKYADSFIFSNCTSLRQIDIPAGVTDLPQSVFEGAQYLEKVTMPDSLELVGMRAFYDCVSLKDALLPNSVQYIGPEAFVNCSSLTNFRYPRSWEGREGYMCENLLGGCPQITEITVPEGVTKIPHGAFASCEYLEKIHLPTTLVEIEEEAFRDCTALTEVPLYWGVRTIGGKAFMGCTALEEINLPDTVETLENGATFAGCTSLESFRYPTGLKTVGVIYGSIFKNCPKLTEIVVTEGTTVIPVDAFYGCESIVRIQLPSTLREIENSAFGECTGLEEISFQDGLLKIGEYAFKKCVSLKTVDLPDSVEHIQAGIFSDCTALESFDYPLSWTNTLHYESLFSNVYGGRQVSGCTKITKLVVPEGVVIIPDNAFSDCDNLTEVVLPSTLVEIRPDAFKDCGMLTKVNIPASVQLIGKDAFANCGSLTIDCTWGTAGQQYAEANGIDQKYLSSYGVILPEGTLYEGEDFTFYGSVRASKEISLLTAEILSGNGEEVVQQAVCTPARDNIRLQEFIGDLLDFAVLPTGTYQFRLSIKVGGITEGQLESEFLVIAKPPAVLKSDMESPSGIYNEGDDFAFAGNLTSLEFINYVNVSIVEVDGGREVRAYSAMPYALQYDLAEIRQHMRFSALSPGWYYYRVEAVLGEETYPVEETCFRIVSEAENIERAARLDDAMRGSSSSSNDDLLYESVILSNAAYSAYSANQNLTALGFDKIDYETLNPEDHTIGFYLAHKDIANDDGTFTRVYAIICRGTRINSAKEWISNFTFTSPTGYHYGFYQAATAVRNRFAQYVADNMPENGDKSSCKVWVTGHSRGGAVANILGGAFLMDDGFSRSNVHTYTFACPKVYKGDVSGANNVFNYNIGGDLVPRVPLEAWGYDRYGKTTTLDNGEYAFGKYLTDKESMDGLEEWMSDMKSVELLERAFTQELQKTGDYSVKMIMLLLAGTVYEVGHSVLPEVDDLGSTLEKLPLWLDIGEVAKDAGATHACETYVRWITGLSSAGQ